MTRIDYIFAATAPGVGFRQAPNIRKSQVAFSRNFPYSLRSQVQRCMSSTSESHALAQNLLVRLETDSKLEKIVGRNRDVQNVLFNMSELGMNDHRIESYLKSLESQVTKVIASIGNIVDIPGTSIKLCFGNRDPGQGELEYYGALMAVIKQYSPEEFANLEKYTAYIRSVPNIGRGGIDYYNGILINPNDCSGSVDASKTAVHEGSGHLEMENMFPTWQEFSKENSYDQRNVPMSTNHKFLASFSAAYEGLKPLTMTREIYARLVDSRYRLKLMNGIANNLTTGVQLADSDVEQLELIDPNENLQLVKMLLDTLEQDVGINQLTEDGKELVQKMRLAERDLTELYPLVAEDLQNKILASQQLIQIPRSSCTPTDSDIDNFSEVSLDNKYALWVEYKHESPKIHN